MSTPLNPDFAAISENPRSAAISLLRQSGHEDAVPVDPVLLCELNDWPLTYEELDQPGVLATTFATDNKIQIVLNVRGTDNALGLSNEKTLRRRQRFSLAHELGHAWFSSHNNAKLQKQLTNEANPHRFRYERIRESQANEFASELLMPQSHVGTRLKKFKWDNFVQALEDFCVEFDVSSLAAAFRLAKIAPFAAIAIYFREDGKSRQLPSWSPDFKEAGFFFQTGSDAPSGSLVQRLISQPDRQVSKMRHRNALTWFSNKRADQFLLDEWVIPLGRYGYLAFLALTEDQDYN